MTDSQRPDWDTYFMMFARIVATRSTCLHRQVGAVIVKDRRILSTGYNGAPIDQEHCLDIGCNREGIPSGQRHELCRGVHAETNAINFAARDGVRIEGGTIFSTHHLCSVCAKSAVNVGLVRVVYAEDYPDPLAEEILSNLEVTRKEL